MELNHAGPQQLGVGPTPIPSRAYYPQLDGVRAIAVMMVMTLHLAQQGIPLRGPIVIGKTGVDLFFVLSGFLITGILLKSPQRDWHEVRTFYIRRTLRIFPLYYGMLLLLLLTGSPISKPYWFYLQNLFSAFNITIQGPSHFWSLAVEEQFYLVCPFLVLFLPRKYLAGTLAGIAAFAFACRFPLIHWHISPFSFTLSRVDGLAGGGLLAYAQYRGVLKRLRPALLTLFLVSVLVVAIDGKLAAQSSDLLFVQMTEFSALAGLYTSAVGLLLLQRQNFLYRMLASSPLRFVGRISYGLYVFHPVVFSVVFAALHQKPAAERAFAGLAATFACALVSWFGMERYLIALKDKLAPERAKFPIAAPSMSIL